MEKIWCDVELIFYTNHCGKAQHITSIQQTTLWKSIIHQKEIFLSAAWPLSIYSKESFHLYYSSSKYSTLMAHNSVHRALILQTLVSLINQHSPCCVQLFDFACSLASSFWPHSIVSSLFLWPLHFLLFLKRKVGPCCKIILDLFFKTSDPIFSNWYKNYLMSVVCDSMCILFLVPVVRQTSNACCVPLSITAGRQSQDLLYFFFYVLVLIFKLIDSVGFRQLWSFKILSVSSFWSHRDWQKYCVHSF